MQALADDFLSDAAGIANKKRILVPGARFAPFAPRISHSQLRHDRSMLCAAWVLGAP
jgi:hypothetical protein